MSRERAASVAAALALLVLAVAVAVAGARRERHQMGSNYVPPVVFSAILAPRTSVCQSGQSVPAGTGALRLRLGTYDKPGPRVRIDITSARGPDLTGGLRPGWRQGDVVVPLARSARRDRDSARVCLHNAGPGAVAVAGGPGTEFPPAESAGGTGLPIRLEFLSARPQSWWAFAGGLIHRVGVVRQAFPGGGTLMLWLVLLIAVPAAAVSLVLREGGA